jgi:putative ABC transport system permease protein
MGIFDDVRHAVRALVRAPGFSLVIVLTLALGIGATTAIFSVVNAVILQPLAYPQPGELVHISSQFPNQGFDQFWISPPEFLELQERARSFDAIGAFAIGQANLTAPDRPRRVNAARVSAELFAALNVQPMIGRWFELSETRPNGAPVVILSYEVWRSSYGGDAAVVGRSVEVNGQPLTVVGVMPPRFDLMDRHVEVWAPLVLNPAQQNRGNHYLYLIGRLKDGTTLAAARAEMDTLLAAWPSSIAQTAGANQGPHTPHPTLHRLRLDELQTQIVGSARTAVLVLQGAVILVLLIACANVASLLLARAESRHREFAVRSALGAGKWQLLRRFMSEGLVLSIVGAAVGLAIGVLGVRALIAAYPNSLPRSADVVLDLRVLAFTVIVAVASAVVFGFAPLFHLAPATTAAALKEGGQRTTGGARNRLRRGLVAAEVALAVALVIGAGLLLRTVLNLSRVDTGFTRGQLLTFGISLPPPKYASGPQILSFYQRLMDELRGVPAVSGVAAMTGLPPVRDVNANDTMIEGYTPPPGGPGHNIEYYQTISNGYIETMGIPLVAGRTFLPTDAIGAPLVLVNETMANAYYGSGQSALGRRVRPSGANQTWFTIVGVLKDVKQGGVEKKTGTELYFSFEQRATLVPQATPLAMNLVVRTAADVASLAGTIHGIVNQLDATLPVIRLRAMDEVFDEAIARQRLLARLLGLFAALAVTLAAIGSYGVLSYMVTERRREIGIRMALGAGRDTVMRMVLSQGLRLAVAGIVIGLAMAFAMNRVLSTLLFGVSPSDPLTVGAVIVMMTGVAAIGCYLPARFATRVDPMIVLRED